MEAICDDLEAEHAALDAVLDGLSEDQWNADTPAEGWTIKDQISHLAFFDETGTAAAVDHDAFRAGATELMKSSRGVDTATDIGRAKTGAEVLEWWRAARAAMLGAFRALDPKDRLPWYGPDMGARSFATARLMETWAHGQDVIDALGVEREATDRLRHVAHIGVGARRFAYTVNSLEMPEPGVYVELTSPSGDTWTWGDPEWNDSIKGNALDWCLLVTQRRHIDDTSLEIVGDAAKEWASIAQSFAGPPGGGRQPLGS
ncbi:MAG: TIGR03084 family metal-binding protein [Acidimicrobiales bacterium]